MEGLSPDTFKELTDKAKHILFRLNEAEGKLKQLKQEIENNFGVMPGASPLRTKKEACNFLKISLVTLDRLIADRAIKTFKVGRKSVRIHENELKSFISN